MCFPFRPQFSAALLVVASFSSLALAGIRTDDATALGYAGLVDLRDEGFAERNGDLNADGAIDPLDAFYLLQWQLANGPEGAPLSCQGQRLVNGDINGDGRVELNDAIALLDAVLGGPTEIVPACDHTKTQDEIADEEEPALNRVLNEATTYGRVTDVLGKKVTITEVDQGPLTVIRAHPVYKVRLHVIRTADNDGSRSANITANGFKNVVNEMNFIYYKAGIEFVFDPATDFEHKNATVLNHQFTVLDDLSQYTDPDEAPPESATISTWNTAFRRATADLHRGKIVLFFSWGSKLVFDENLGHWIETTPSGGSSSSAGRWVNMPKSTNDRAFVAHEIGHYLGVPHPFATTKTVAKAQERIKKYVEVSGYPPEQGLDALDGDRHYVLDTPADPASVFWRDVANAATGDKCGAVAEYTFPVTFSGNLGTWNYTLAPDRNNVMSYFKGCYDLGPRRFSPQQIVRMRDALENMNRHDLISLHADNVTWNLERKGEAQAELVNTTDIVRVGLNRLVTTSISNSTLKLIVWDVDPTDGTFTRRGETQTSSVSQVATAVANNAHVVTAVRTTSGTLKILTWKVTAGGVIYSVDQETAGNVSQVSICRLNRLRVITACRNAAGNLESTVWLVLANGTIHKKGSALAGAIGEVSVTSHGPLQFTTAVRLSDGNLKVIAWEVNKDSEIIRKTSHNAGAATQISAAALDVDWITTAVRLSNGVQKIISWNVNHLGVVRRKSDLTLPSTASEIDSERLGVDLLVTASRTASGNLELNLVEVGEEGSFVSLKDTESAGGASEIALCRAGTNMVVTAVRTMSGNLKLIAWKARKEIYVAAAGPKEAVSPVDKGGVKIGPVKDGRVRDIIPPQPEPMPIPRPRGPLRLGVR